MFSFVGNDLYLSHKSLLCLNVTFWFIFVIVAIIWSCITFLLETGFIINLKNIQVHYPSTVSVS